MNKTLVELLSKISVELALLKMDIKNIKDISEEDYEKCRERINDCQEDMAKFCDCAPIKLIAGKIEDILINNDLFVS